MADIRKKSRKLVLEAGIIGVMFVAALAGAVGYTSKSDFCVKCHEMKPAYQTWQSSAHRNVNCVACHTDPGLIGIIKSKPQHFREVYLHFTNTYEKPIKITSDTKTFSKRCLRCHEDIEGKSPAHNKSHFASDIACTDCHKGMVHNAETNKKPPSTDICEQCHGS